MLTQNNYRHFKKAIQPYVLSHTTIFIDGSLCIEKTYYWLEQKSIQCDLMTTNISVVYKSYMLDIETIN